MVLNTEQNIIIQEVSNIQLDSMVAVYDIITSGEKDNHMKDLGLDNDIMLVACHDTISIFNKLLKDPSTLDQLEILDVTVVLFILTHHQDNWQYRYPVNHRALIQKVTELLLKKRHEMVIQESFQLMSN